MKGRNTMKKKITSLLLAMVMIFALAIPAFADDPTYSDKGTQSITAQGVTRTPTIQVAMPTMGANPFVLNPYKLSFAVKLNGSDTETAADAVAAKQIVAPVYTITNGTGAYLTVDITATGTVGGNLQLATAALGEKAATETKNSVFCGLYAVARTGATATTEAALAVDANLITAIKAGDATKKAALTLSPATVTYAEDGTPTVTTANYIDFTFSGDAAQNPTTGWSSKDTLKVALAFTFNLRTTAPST
jgi:hypothetical protein